MLPVPVHSKLCGKFEVVHQLVEKSNDKLFTTQAVGHHLERSVFRELIASSYDPLLWETVLRTNLTLGPLEVGLNDTLQSFFYGVSLCLATSKG